MSLSAFARLIFDQMLFGRRGPNHSIQDESSTRLPLPSIQPWQSAASSAWAWERAPVREAPVRA
jgi:hypothetical protein